MRNASSRRDALDRSVGALLGLAIGDALGAPAEGKPRDSYPRLTAFAPSPGHGIAGGEWTDDTAMAVCLAQSLLACDGFDPGDLMQRFLRWYRHGENSCGAAGAGISPTTSATLERFERTGRLDAAEAAGNAGNGCIMRLAPVAIRWRKDGAAAERVAREQARLTHTAPEAVEAAARLASILVGALGGGDKAVLVPRALGAAPREAISSAPRAGDTLEAALWCVCRTDDFASALIEAVNLGGDTDTIGAVTGQIAGALFGAAAIPEAWRAGLRDGARLRRLAEELHRAAGRAKSDALVPKS
jgi:ADP-ribosyl-[dinitrogen reductase] hydrolase